MCCAVFARSRIDWYMRCEASTVHAQGQFTYVRLIRAHEQTWTYRDEGSNLRVRRHQSESQTYAIATWWRSVRLHANATWDGHSMLVKANCTWCIDWIKPANLYTQITIKMTHDQIQSTPIFSERTTTSSAQKGHTLVAANVACNTPPKLSEPSRPKLSEPSRSINKSWEDCSSVRLDLHLPRTMCHFGLLYLQTSDCSSQFGS